MQTSLLIIDDIFPSNFSPFRDLEYTHYLKFFGATVLTTGGWHHYVPENPSLADILNASGLDSKDRCRVLPFVRQKVAAKLAYVTFLNNAWAHRRYLRKYQIPFILQLYPGGGMELNQPDVDDKLRGVLLSPLLRKVITTQNVTRDYVVGKIGCDPQKIEHIFGGVFRLDEGFDFWSDKFFFGRGKDTTDICFVAHRYENDLSSKGYDRFVDVCREISARIPHARFHVVGSYTRDAINVSDFAERITFYGVRDAAFFADFYPRMDIILSLNRPFVLNPGSYDGFPTGACMEAGFRGVLNCINDPLSMNLDFADGKDIVILDDDMGRTIDRIAGLLANTDELYRLASANCRSFRSVLNTDKQLMARSRVITRELISDHKPKLQDVAKRIRIHRILSNLRGLSPYRI